MGPSLETIKDLGEQGVLKRLQRYCASDIVGDDAAVLPVTPGYLLVVTTDVLVDNVHFSDRTTTPEDVGWRSAAANLSDLAAMGAFPLGITVGLSLSSEVPIAWVERLYQGLQACLQQYQTSILGGDICRSSVITVAITAFGQVEPSQVIRRSTAQPGDAIVVTGYHGASRAGLELLLHPEQGKVLTTAAQEYLIQAHQRPKPRLDVREQLKALACDRVAGMDSSDGLADAVIQICQSSQVGAQIDGSAIPIPPALRQLTSPQQAVEWALYGGEDFELVLCLPLSRAQTLVKYLGAGAAIIGTVTAEPEISIADRHGIYASRLTRNKGFQHF